MIRALAALLALWALVAADSARAQVRHEWHLTVGSWNLLNFSMAKATFDNGADRAALLTQMGNIAGGYDIVVFQEVLQNGASVTQHLVNYLPANYVCTWLSAASGRAGRQERYAVCAPPTNAWGTIAIAPLVDYSTTGLNYTAANNTPRPAANVWMRPPAIAAVTFTPTDATFPPKTFQIYTIHTKPAYGNSANARPPGTVANAPNNSVVHYELQAVERNPTGGGNAMLIGDLNSDCTSYPPQYRGTDFAAWTWYVGYGQRTTTAVGSSCGYDRIVMNAGLNAYYEAHAVTYPGYGATTRLDTRRISDHYPVWVRLGEVRNAVKRQLTASATLPVSQAKRQRIFAPTDTVNVSGSNLTPLATTPLLWVTNAVPPTAAVRSYRSNFVYALTDVRGQATQVQTDANGNFLAPVSWANPTAGAYTFVFDVNGDGKFSLRDGDFTNQDSEADIYVGTAADGHNDLTTVGDNMVSRDVFSLAQAKNVYALGRNLPVSFSGNAYIASLKRLKAAGYANWAAARAAGAALTTISIPIQRSGGLIDTTTLTAADMQQPFFTNARGEMFLSIWSKPAQLMGATVNYQTPPSASFIPAEAGQGDPPASPDNTDFDDDPCRQAYQLGSATLRSACAFGYQFADYYGTEFALVLDTNGDGRLNQSDPIDLRDIGDMTTFFAQPANTVLGPNANGNAAVSEYKEYLSRALSVDLTTDRTYDTATMAASGRYACGGLLSKTAFQTWIVPDAASGFRVLDDDAYRSERATTSGLAQYDNAYFDGVDYNDADVCVSADTIDYSGAVTVAAGSNVTNVANSYRLENTTISTNASTLCMLKFQTAGTGFFAAGALSSGITAGGSLLVGVIGAGATFLTGAVVCGLQ